MSFSSVCMRVTPPTMYSMNSSASWSSLPAIPARQQLRIARDGPQRLLQIVRGDISELPQFVVHP